MESKELRIGNWVNSQDGYVLIENGSDIDSADLYLGVSLSPEILLKVGAKQNQYGDEWAYTLNVSAIKIKFRFNGIDCYSELGGIYLADKIEYLHQLQNLYYSLCVHELTIIL